MHGCQTEFGTHVGPDSPANRFTPSHSSSNADIFCLVAKAVGDSPHPCACRCWVGNLNIARSVTVNTKITAIRATTVALLISSTPAVVASLAQQVDRHRADWRSLRYSLGS